MSTYNNRAFTRYPATTAEDPVYRYHNGNFDDEGSTPVPLSIYHPWRQEEMLSPWRLFEERVRTGPYGLSRFPSQPYSPVRILVYGHTNERVNPGLRQFIQDSPPHIQGQWRLPSTDDPAGLTNEEFKKAMKKVRKQVYNPPNNYPKRRAARRKGLFNKSSSSNYNNTNSSSSAAAGDHEEKLDEGGKECVICLESFAANEQVLVTPCNHMFHHDCLVPWLKSQGKCPICRFSLCEGRDMAALAPLSNNNINDLAVDVTALMRAMEEAFNWVNLRRSA